MKKILVTAAIGLLLPLFGADINLEKQESMNLVEDFGKRILANTIDSYDQDKVGTWALKTYHQDKYRQTRNDEFEYDDAKIWALNDFKAKLASTPAEDKEVIYHGYKHVSFGKYDFKTQTFPINIRSLDLPVSASGVIVGYSSVKFSDATKKLLSLKMEKANAKAFIAKRKSKYGSIDRGVLMNCTYKIIDVKSKRKNFKRMGIYFTGKMIGIEFLDPKTKEVIYTIDKTQFLDN